MGYPNSKVLKKVVNGMGEYIPCAMMAFRECDKDGVELHKAILHEHAKTMPCDHPMSEHVNFVFCSDRCKQKYLYSHIELGKLPPGYKLGY